MESFPWGVSGWDGYGTVLSAGHFLAFLRKSFFPVGSKFSLLRLGVFDVTLSQINFHQLIWWKNENLNLRTVSNLTIAISNRLSCLWSEGSFSAMLLYSKFWERLGSGASKSSHLTSPHRLGFSMECALGCSVLKETPRGHVEVTQTVKWGVCRWLYDILFPPSSGKGDDLELGCSSSPGVMLLQSLPMILGLPYAFKRWGKTSSWKVAEQNIL